PGAAGSPTKPATTPAVSPRTMTAPAAGTARTLVSVATDGTPPLSPISSGAVASWALTVVATASAHQRGPRTRSTNGPTPTSSPTVAATDSWNPSPDTISGSISTRAPTARASIRAPEVTRPEVAASSATSAMAAARRTDASALVTSTNATNAPAPRIQRTPSGTLDATGRTSSRTNATF